MDCFSCYAGYICADGANDVSCTLCKDLKILTESSINFALILQYSARFRHRYFSGTAKNYCFGIPRPAGGGGFQRQNLKKRKFLEIPNSKSDSRQKSLRGGRKQGRKKSPLDETSGRRYNEHKGTSKNYHWSLPLCVPHHRRRRWGATCTAKFEFLEMPIRKRCCR